MMHIDVDIDIANRIARMQSGSHCMLFVTGP